MRVNVGCGNYPLTGWINLDASPDVAADVVATVPPLPYADNALDEIYAGHVIEHMTREDGATFLAECRRCLRPGGRVGIVVPDMRAIMGVWLGGVKVTVEYPMGVQNDCSDLDAVNHLFLFSTVQPSHHLWSYDLGTLGRAMTAAGLRVTGEINRMSDPRIPVGAWYQCGLDAVKAGA